MIINLTLHNPTPEQVSVGVVNLSENKWNIVKEALTFDEKPTKNEIMARCIMIRNVLLQSDEPYPVGQKVMVGGAMYLIPTLVRMLKESGFKPVCAFTKRVLKEHILNDGTVKQERVLSFEGFVEC